MTAWRHRCPEGHVSLQTRPRCDYTYCQTCDANYPDMDIVDAKLTDDPDPREE